MITVTQNINLGRNVYQIGGIGESFFEALGSLKKLSFFGVEKCGICGKDNLYFDTHYGLKNGKPAFEYSQIKCRDCKASATFGKKQDDPLTVFLRKDENKNIKWEVFTTKENN